MFRTEEYYDVTDDTAGISSDPATASRYVGTAFQQQAVTGTRLVDTEDDRVTFEADIRSSSPQAFSIGLGSDLDATGVQSVYGGTIFRGIAYGDPGDTGPDDGRPRVGFPLSHEPDAVYASRTGDMAGDTVNDEFGYLVGAGVRLVEESPLDYADRASEHPAEVQHAMPFDVVMGAWPWTGEKVALQRPVAAEPMTFRTPLLDAIPSPTGTSNADLESQYNVYPRPLTFRMPPEPWDTNNDGQYVDGG